MQREIKFRAWDSIDKKWLFGYGYKSLGGFSLLGEVVLLGEISSISLDRLPDIEIDQFTGLQDNNLADIYESDILQDSSKRKWLCEWNSNHACFAVKSLEDNHVYIEVIDNQNMKVIGNIHEHPRFNKMIRDTEELLKRKK